MKRLVAVVAALLALSASAEAAPLVGAVGEVRISVADAPREAAFLHEVLAFDLISDREVSGAELDRLYGVFGVRLHVIELRLGSERVTLDEFVTPRGRPVPADTRSNDHWFQHLAIVVRDMDAAYQRLREHGVASVSTEPQTLPAWNRNAGGIKAFYFHDPEGHTLELIWFPPGKGLPRWHEKSDKLFLGIDHTAIAVGDTGRALKLYRDGLGLQVAGASENWGVEQEHLNAVFGAHLRITALRAAGGPGIELLEYLAPRDGRSAELRANDLAHWSTVLETRALSEAEKVVRSAAGTLSSPEIVRLHAPLGFSRGELVHDPDGHGLLLVERNPKGD
jgi:catechol 2,3-dioxygenase-like lactoylglutathione lyase family enzyme